MPILRFVVLISLGGTAVACNSVPRSRPDAAEREDGGVQTDGGRDASQRECTVAGGSFREREISSEGEERFYFLYVPERIACRGAPVWVHFHGTAQDRPEEAYQLEAMVQRAREFGAILLRPRSRFAARDGFGRVYQWDINPGDLDRNRRMVEAIVTELAEQYPIDRSRLYASGFSSGTNMAAQFMGSDSLRFRGFAFFAGGYWAPVELTETAEVAAVYGVTGFRDYLHPSWVSLRAAMLEAGLSEDALFERQVDAGHELYEWHIEEAFDWLMERRRPPPPEPAADWEMLAAADETLVELATNSRGELFGVGAEGGVYRHRGESWTRVVDLSDSTSGALSDICFRSDGVGMVVGSGVAALTSDDGETFRVLRDVPEYPNSTFGSAWFNAVACDEDSFVAGGYWTGNRTGDGDSWEAALMLNSFGTAAQVSSIAFASPGVAVAVGYYDYLGVMESGAESFSPLTSLPTRAQWYNGVEVASEGRVWVVGEGGTVLASSDDGRTWRDRSIDTSDDLYAMTVNDEGVGFAVGVHGAIFGTRDGGASFENMNPGVDTTLTDALIVVERNRADVWVVGEGGTTLRRSLSE